MTKITPREPTAGEIAEREAWAAEELILQRKLIEDARRADYFHNADPLFFKWQAGEATKEEWLAKRAEIAERYPYPEKVE